MWTRRGRRGIVTGWYGRAGHLANEGLKERLESLQTGQAFLEEGSVPDRYSPFHET